MGIPIYMPIHTHTLLYPYTCPYACNVSRPKRGLYPYTYIACIWVQKGAYTHIHTLHAYGHVYGFRTLFEHT